MIFVFICVCVYIMSSWNNDSIFSISKFSGREMNLVGAIESSKWKMFIDFWKRLEKLEFITLNLSEYGEAIQVFILKYISWLP